MFHLQSQWSPETHLLPVRSASETTAWNPFVSFCDHLLTFLGPSIHQFSLDKFFYHSFMNCGLRHFRNDVMQLSYRHASICMNFSFSFLKKVVRDQRWPSARLFAVNISPSFGEFTAPICHILLIHNVTINSNNLFVNFLWTFTFALRNCTKVCTSHLAGLWIGTDISNMSHSTKASSTTGKRAKLTRKGSRSMAVFVQ